MLLPSNAAEDFESLLEALRIVLRSVDFTFNELPVDNFVIVTEPIDDPLLAPDELGSLESRFFEDKLEVTVEDIEDLSGPEEEDGNSLSLDVFEWVLVKLEETFEEELCDPVDISSLLLTGDMVTPSFLPHFVGVPPVVDPKSFPIASSTLSLFESLIGLSTCLLVPVPSFGPAMALCTLDIADEFNVISPTACFTGEMDSLVLSNSHTFENLTLFTS